MPSPRALPAAPVTSPDAPPTAFPAEADMSPAVMDCQPALSARIPVSRAVAFFATSKTPYTMTSFAMMFSIPFSKKTRSAPAMIGSTISISCIAITVPNTLKDCTRKAVSHCFDLPPLSNGREAKIGGAIR